MSSWATPTFSQSFLQLHLSGSHLLPSQPRVPPGTSSPGALFPCCGSCQGFPSKTLAQSPPASSVVAASGEGCCGGQTRGCGGLSTPTAPPEHRLPGMAIAMGMVAYVTFLPALLSTGKVWGRSIRTLFLKDAIPRCSAEGEMLGRGPGGCVREGKRVFSLAGCFSPAICHICSRRGRAQAARHSPAWREQLTQLDEGQHQPSPKPVPCRGTVLFRALPDTSTTGQAPLPSQDSGSHLLCPLVSTLA